MKLWNGEHTLQWWWRRTKDRRRIVSTMQAGIDFWGTTSFTGNGGVWKITRVDLRVTVGSTDIPVATDNLTLRLGWFVINNNINFAFITARIFISKSINNLCYFHANLIFSGTFTLYIKKKKKQKYEYEKNLWYGSRIVLPWVRFKNA